MILELLIVLIVLGAAASGAAMVWKRAPLYTGLASLAIWMVVGYSSSSIDLVTDSGGIEEGVASEPALAALAFGNAALSFLVVLAAATGQFSAADESGTDRTVDPNTLSINE